MRILKANWGLARLLLRAACYYSKQYANYTGYTIFGDVIVYMTHPYGCTHLWAVESWQYEAIFVRPCGNYWMIQPSCHLRSSSQSCDGLSPPSTTRGHITKCRYRGPWYSRWFFGCYDVGHSSISESLRPYTLLRAACISLRAACLSLRAAGLMAPDRKTCRWWIWLHDNVADNFGKRASWQHSNFVGMMT